MAQEKLLGLLHLRLPSELLQYDRSQQLVFLALHRGSRFQSSLLLGTETVGKKLQFSQRRLDLLLVTKILRKQAIALDLHLRDLGFEQGDVLILGLVQLGKTAGQLLGSIKLLGKLLVALHELLESPASVSFSANDLG